MVDQHPQQFSSSAIEAVDFQPSDAPDKGRLIPTWQIVLASIGLLVAVVLWFLFTTKSVQFVFMPTANQVSVSGGASFELGGVYLLREGDYIIDAIADLHEPMQASIAVGEARNQEIQLAFTPLPGFVDLALHPLDAIVILDGVDVSAKANARMELSAGQHEMSVSHPRYQPTQLVLDIEGKQIVQKLSVTLLPNWSQVSIESTPTNAQILIDNEVLEQRTPAVIEALAGERSIRVELDGFKTHRERIFAQAGVPQTLQSIKLVQADAQISVDSTPDGAGVTVNGKYVGQTPIQLDLQSGRPHMVQIIRSGYENFTRSLNLSRGSNDQLLAQLKRQLGELVVQVLPADAELSIDGKPMYSANVTIDLPIREHEISISKEGYAGYTQTITPKVGLVQEVKVKLLTLAEARLAALKPTITTAQGQNLVLFEPFAFTMGASRREPGRRANETLRDANMQRFFYLATQEVTNAAFLKFATGHDSGKYEEENLNDEDMPVVNVAWHEAAAYCNWLSAQENLAPFYQIEYGKVLGFDTASIGYRLPTEAEWAWAARTLPDSEGASTEKQLRFPWGANLPPPDRHGNYADRSAAHLVGRVIFGFNDNHATVAPVGTFKPNIRGLYDMGGNVAEWIHDYYEIPGPDAVADPLGADSGEYHVIRGSSWMHGTITELRFSFRDYGTDGRQDIGFRLARFAE
jgi:formylglycine-generating enzyme required for sulfatase activity